MSDTYLINNLHENIKKSIKKKKVIKLISNFIGWIACGIFILLTIIFIIKIIEAQITRNTIPFSYQYLILYLIFGIIVLICWSIYSNCLKKINDIASKMAKVFFIEKTKLCIEKFFEELEINYTKDDVTSIITNDENEDIFAKFDSKNELTFYFRIHSNGDQFSLRGLKRQNGQNIVIKKICIEESDYDGDICIINYRQFSPIESEEIKKGITAQKMEYYIPLHKLSKRLFEK